MIAYNDIRLLDDKDLLINLRSGNAVAFDEIYKRYWKSLYGEAYKRLKNKNDSFDVVQNVFVDIWAKRDTLKIQQLKAYLFQATRYQVYKIFIQSARKSYFPKLLEEIISSKHSADYKLLDKEINSELQKWIKGLPKQRRTAFILRFEESLSIHEISLKLGISPKTVKNQLTHAYKWVKRHAKEFVTFLMLLRIF